MHLRQSGLVLAPCIFGISAVADAIGMIRAPLVCSVMVLAQTAWAGQETLTERPPPATPQQVTTPLEESFQKTEPPEPNAITQAADQILLPLSPFLRDTQLTLKPRTYYFDQDLPGGKGTRAWAG